MDNKDNQVADKEEAKANSQKLLSGPGGEREDEFAAPMIAMEEHGEGESHIIKDVNPSQKKVQPKVSRLF
jgi:hypothetical protein